jgi:hypothetical protein
MPHCPGISRTQGGVLDQVYTETKSSQGNVAIRRLSVVLKSNESERSKAKARALVPSTRKTLQYNVMLYNSIWAQTRNQTFDGTFRCVEH